MDLKHRLSEIVRLNLSDEHTEKLLTEELENDNLFNTLDMPDVGVNMAELGLTLDDLDDNSNMFAVSEDEKQSENFAKAKIVNLYRYVAHSSSGYSSDLGENSRSFCSKLVSRTRISLMRYHDILRLNGSNKGMGMNGANVYNVFKWRGGVNCKHLWVKYKYNMETQSLEKASQAEQPTQTGQGSVPNA